MANACGEHGRGLWFCTKAPLKEEIPQIGEEKDEKSSSGLESGQIQADYSIYDIFICETKKARSRMEPGSLRLGRSLLLFATHLDGAFRKGSGAFM